MPGEYPFLYETANFYFALTVNFVLKTSWHWQVKQPSINHQDYRKLKENDSLEHMPENKVETNVSFINFH